MAHNKTLTADISLVVSSASHRNSNVFAVQYCRLTYTSDYHCYWAPATCIIISFTGMIIMFFWPEIHIYPFSGAPNSICHCGDGEPDTPREGEVLPHSHRTKRALSLPAWSPHQRPLRGHPGLQWGAQEWVMRDKPGFCQEHVYRYSLTAAVYLHPQLYPKCFFIKEWSVLV